MKNLSRREWVAGVAAFGTTASSWQARSQSPALRIGVIAPLSGNNIVTGKPVLFGAEVARDYINRNGGVLGRQIELVVRNDRGEPPAAVQAARELAGEGINLILGAPLTATALAVSGIAPSINAVYVATGTNADALTHELYNPNFFTVVDNNYSRCRAYALLMAQRFPEINKWGAIFPDVAAGHSAWNAMVPALKTYYEEVNKKNIEIVDPVLTVNGATDFKSYISRLVSSPVEGLLSVVFGSDGITFLQQARPFGLDRKLKALCDYSLNLDIGKALKGATPTIWAITQWYPSAHPGNPLSDDLLAESISRTNDPFPPGITALGHAGVMAFAAAVTAARSAETPAVINALAGMRLDTAKGPMVFRKEDHQGIGSIDFIRMGPQDAEPRWGVHESLSIDGAQVVNAPTPGVALKL